MIESIMLEFVLQPRPAAPRYGLPCATNRQNQCPNLHNLVSHQREPWLLVASSKCVRFVLSLVRFSAFADKEL